MEYKYNGFIPENTAVENTKKIGVYNAKGERLFGIMPNNLKSATNVKQYSFGVISDLHIDGVTTSSSVKLDNALAFFEEQGCQFCCHAGDVTNIGFWYNSADTEIYLTQFAEYKRIKDLHPNLPLFGVCGNHESYSKSITENLAELEEYTGYGLYYTVNHNDDVFIMIGQPKGNNPMNLEELQWLYETLEENRNKRCFIFVHPFISSDSGNAFEVYENRIFDWWEHTPVFKSLLNHYKNTVLFHGHSHLKFDHQLDEVTANYTDKNGFMSVHIPSVQSPSEIVDGERTKSTEYESLGYVVDVYENYIILKARNFGSFDGNEMINPSWIPIGTYKLDTTLTEIKANTFTDSTGIITT